MTRAHSQTPLLGSGLLFASLALSALSAIALTTGGLADFLWYLVPAVSGFSAVNGIRNIRSRSFLVGTAVVLGLTIGAIAGTMAVRHMESSRGSFLALVDGQKRIDARVLSTRSERNGSIRLALCLPVPTCEYGFEGVFSSGWKIAPDSLVAIDSPQRKFETGTGYLFSQGLLASVRGNLSNLEPPVQPGTLDQIRSELKGRLAKLFPPDEAALAAGMLVGEKSLFRDELSEMYRHIGLSHLVVVSGSNIAFVLVFLGTCTLWMARRFRVPLLLSATIGYIVLVGAEPPVLRAGIMGLIAYSFVEYGNRVDALRTLLFAALVLCLISPFSLLHDAGFQLSALATLGLVTASAGISNALKPLRLPEWIRTIIASSFAASLFTLPVTLAVFGSTHIASILANIAIAPFVGPALLGAATGLLGTFLGDTLGYALGFIGYWPLAACNTIAAFFASLPGHIAIEEDEWRMWAGLVFASVDVLWVVAFILGRKAKKH